MNQQSHASCSCDDWGELISAMLDHELTADERVATEAHLACCQHCRQRASTLEGIDQLIRTPCEVDGSRIMARQAELQGTRCAWSYRGLPGHGATWLTFGTAAVLLLGFVGFVRWLPSMQTNSPAEVVRPVAHTLETLSSISQQQRRTQEMAREALQWELRTLKLELDQLQLPPDESRRFRDRLAELTDQLEYPSIDNPYTNPRERT